MLIFEKLMVMVILFVIKIIWLFGNMNGVKICGWMF